MTRVFSSMLIFYVHNELRVGEAHKVARDARTKILKDVKDVLDVDMHLELDSRRYFSERRPCLDETHPELLRTYIINLGRSLIISGHGINNTNFISFPFHIGTIIL